ncbi:MAG: BlaI/MecI/CopY family transcriptional regulator [Lachnospiraceae bacterium]|nr:BlaI/MecI/CopY family transcriptional regulator [Lachnospiraceae bacterium]
MKKNYGLTNTEMQIMELLWSSEKPMSFREIMNIATTEWNKTWKVQTLNTFLNGLQKMKLIRAEQSPSSPYQVYYPLRTKEQHIHEWTKEMVEVCYDNSFSRLVAAFIGDGKLTKEDAEELKKLL